MLDGLHEHEHAPEDEGHEADPLQLQNGIRRAGRSHDEIGQDQRQGGQGSEHRERGGRALKLEGLLEVLAPAEDEAEADNAIENDHHRREHRVPCDALGALGPGKHDRDNEPSFDHRHRDGKKDRAERLAKLERQHLGMMDGGEHGGGEKETGENQYVGVVGRDDISQLQRHKSARQQRHSPGPGRNGGVVRRRHRSIPLGEVRLCKSLASRAIRAGSLGRHVDALISEAILADRLARSAFFR